jgi:cytochrome c556
VAKAKEFHGFYVEMEKGAKGLQATLQSGDLPKSGIAYGRILKVCATCHRKFRD